MQLEAPRIEEHRAFTFAGMRETFTAETMAAVPELWNRFGPRIGTIPGERGDAAYGLALGMTAAGPGIEYVAAVEISTAAALPADLAVVEAPARLYAIFPHRSHVSRIGEAVGQIFQSWLPTSGFEHAGESGTPDLIERYGPNFDPMTGMGDTEIWIPIRRIHS